MTKILHFSDTQGQKQLRMGRNFVYSPLSIWAAIGLLAPGARGPTLGQLLSFLASPSLDSLNSAARCVLDRLISSGNDRSLLFASSIWIAEGMALKPSFQNTAKSVYRAGVKTADFANDGPQTVKQINAWISDNTDGRIDSVLSDLDPKTRAVLANALYFKGTWAKEFIRSRTKIDTFYLADGKTTVQVPYMTNFKNQYLRCCTGFKVLRLPYRRNAAARISMLLYLPDEKDGLDRLIKRAVSDHEFFDKYYPDRDVAVERLKVPKFKLSGLQFEATEILKELGLELPFAYMGADFGEMTEDEEELMISRVDHAATIEVDEEGTVAAAMTLMIAPPGMSCAPARAPPLEFVADHPFMFVVREESTGALLFVGHVADPSKCD